MAYTYFLQMLLEGNLNIVTKWPRFQCLFMQCVFTNTRVSPHVTPTSCARIFEAGTHILR